MRVPPKNIPIGTGKRRPGKRVLTVGADCAIGKKYAALAINREMQSRGWNSDFRATGQTGIMIAGSGIPLDAVVSDFLSGAAEAVSPANADNHWDVIEGQGSLFHPSYAGVSLGLLHGAQPDAIVVCHDLSRGEIDGCSGFGLPDIDTTIARNLEAAQLTNSNAKCAGIALNTSALPDQEARAQLRAVSAQYRLPCVDPVRWGVASIVDYLADF